MPEVSVPQRLLDRGPGPGPVEVALLDREGVVVAVNDEWRAFAAAAGGDPARTGVGASYLAACDADAGDPVARAVGAAVRAAVRGELPAALKVEVPCAGPDGERWFDVLVSSRLGDDGGCLGATVTLSPSAASSSVPPPPPVGRSALARLLASVPGLVEGRPGRLDDLPAAARELLDARTAVLTVLSGDGTLAAVLSDGPPPQDLGVVGEPPEALGLLGLLLRRSGPLRLDDVRTHPAAARTAGSGALLGTPVTSRGRVLGALHVVGDRAGGFSERDEDLLGALADCAATGVEVARRRQALDERQRWAHLARELTAHPLADEPELLARVLDLAGRGLGTSDTALLLTAGRGTDLVQLTRSSATGRAAAAGAADPVVADVVTSGRAGRGEPGQDTAVAVPLRLGTRLHGVLAAARSAPVTDDELRELEGLAHSGGLALQLLRAQGERRALHGLRRRVLRAAELQERAVRELERAGPGSRDVLEQALALLRDSVLTLRTGLVEAAAAGPAGAPAGGDERVGVLR